MTTYLEFHPSQVQTYLTRWSDLKGRRGASQMLRDAASSRVIDELLVTMPGVRRNPDVPDVDGAISVILDSADLAIDAEQQIMGHLRETCPAAQFHVASGSSEGPHDEATYRRIFHRQIMPTVNAGTAQVSLAPVSELPTAMRCTKTGGDLSVGAASISNNERHSVGLDVLTRIDRADWRTSQARAAARAKTAMPDTALSLEDELAKRIGFDNADIFDSEVEDFEQLADLGPPRKRNHLATVFIDGNRIGELIDNCRDDELIEVSKALSEATWGALAQATIAVCTLTGTGPGAVTADRRRLAVLPHIVGGDDVLVTMPAFTGLTFTRTFLRIFTTECEGITGSGGVSASAGVIVHHRKFPFTRAADHANDVLAAAKRATQGRSASLALAELTRDSTNVVHPDMAWHLSDLDANVDLLEAMAGWPNSMRSTLEQAIAPAIDLHRLLQQRHAQNTSASVAELKEFDETVWVSASSVLLTLRRSPSITGGAALIDRITAAGASGSRREVEGELVFVGRALSISRWWLTEEGLA